MTRSTDEAREGTRPSHLETSPVTSRPDLTRRACLCLGALAGLTVVGCGSPVRILRMSQKESPGALPGFAVEALDFEGFVMKGEPLAKWLETRSPEQKASFENDKAKLAGAFMGGLQQYAPELKFAWSSATPTAGFGLLKGRILGEMSGIFTLANGSGEVLDEIEVRYEVGWGDITSHMHMFGGFAGEAVGNHLGDRRG